MLRRFALVCWGALSITFAQSGPTPPPPSTPQSPPPTSASVPSVPTTSQTSPSEEASQAAGPGGFRHRDEPNGGLAVQPGTRILLSMINSISTRQAQVGDRIYLETAFPVLTAGHIVIPQGSWVVGEITEVKRPGRVKGRGELQVKFDSLTLPNGVSRDFRSDLAAIDPRSDEKLKREESKISGPGNKSGDLGTVVGSTTAGTVIGSGIGAAAGNAARGAGIGAGAGAAAGLLGVLLTRGPDATLTKGSTVEMVLDRQLTFDASELDFRNAPPRATLSEGETSTDRSQRRNSSRLPFPY